MELFDVYPLLDVEPVKGKGAYVWDKDGNKYLDFYGGHAVISIGHSHSQYVEKIQVQLQQLGFYSNSVINPLQGELARKLGELSSYPNYQLFLCNSGAEAVENALKLASFSTGKKKVVAFSGGFHGRTSGALSVTDNPKLAAPFNGGHLSEILPWNDVKALKVCLQGGDVAAVIIEGIQGLAGIHEASSFFWKAIRELCDQYDCLLIVDEVQSGYGRSGKFFAHQHYGIKADLITVAKGMGNGFPIGGVLIHPDIEAHYGMLGTTFGGNHLACSAGIVVLDVLKEEGLIQHAAKMGDLLREELTFIPKIKTISGKGLMLGLDFDFPVKNLRNQLVIQEKIFTGAAANPNIMRLLPPLSISEKDVKHFVKGLKHVL
ncbi:aspartate aminotransferase family protein [Xanthovirga aplysinae]|uniref:aspartate aminotransferase family protein n=1 Tax=Xanthovirga aplysinae TaxID=2529853 RepID=UPI0012BCECD4|nr:aminotransferase class III-fold pyridoxal phosphate-dependent enzyme [Xanthovirga aplysinae]MTI32735.1 aspartate aminotransferase family protein [Xanthovirga aplysinae]